MGLGAHSSRWPLLPSRTAASFYDHRHIHLKRAAVKNFFIDVRLFRFQTMKMTRIRTLTLPVCLNGDTKPEYNGWRSNRKRRIPWKKKLKGKNITFCVIIVKFYQRPSGVWKLVKKLQKYLFASTCYCNFFFNQKPLYFPHKLKLWGSILNKWKPQTYKFLFTFQSWTEEGRYQTKDKRGRRKGDQRFIMYTYVIRVLKTTNCLIRWI